MGKLISTVGGIIAIVAGALLLLRWKAAFMICLKGMCPAFLILAGLIAAYAGISEMKDEAARKKEEAKRKTEEKK